MRKKPKLFIINRNEYGYTRFTIDGAVSFSEYWHDGYYTRWKPTPEFIPGYLTVNDYTYEFCWTIFAEDWINRWNDNL